MAVKTIVDPVLGVVSSIVPDTELAENPNAAPTLAITGGGTGFSPYKANILTIKEDMWVYNEDADEYGFQLTADNAGFIDIASYPPECCYDGVVVLPRPEDAIGCTFMLKINRQTSVDAYVTDDIYFNTYHIAEHVPYDYNDWEWTRYNNVYLEGYTWGHGFVELTSDGKYWFIKAHNNQVELYG